MAQAGGVDKTQSQKGRRFVAAGVVVGVLLAAVLGIAWSRGGGSEDDGGGGASPSAETGAETEAETATWEQVVPGEDCVCADGSEFSFWVRKGDPDKVVFFFQDGGACFSAETCNPDAELYNTAVTEGPDEAGVFAFGDERNPFADYSVVYVPYCSGDVFLGNATTEYAPGLTIEHKGSVNGSAALDYLATTFPDATDVVVMGESAGSAPAPVYGGLVADRLPDAEVTVLANGSGSYPDLAEFNSRVATAWGVTDSFPEWPELAAMPAEDWAFSNLFVQSGRRHSDVVFARVDYAYDGRQAVWYPALGIPVEDLRSRIDANEALIEAAGVDLLSFTPAGTSHTALNDEAFYTETVDGQTLVDWVTAVVERRPVEDAHCTECEAG
jgi:hypothetical protein